MSKYVWALEMNKYDESGQKHLVIHADRLSVYEGAICFYRVDEKAKSPENVWEDGEYLVAYMPTDRVMSVEMLDKETGEPVGFMPGEPL